MTWLVVARAVQGMGGGGIIQLVQITISDIVSLQEYVSFVYSAFFRSHLFSAGGASTEAISAQHGALLGPLFTVCLTGMG